MRTFAFSHKLQIADRFGHQFRVAVAFCGRVAHSVEVDGAGRRDVSEAAREDALDVHYDLRQVLAHARENVRRLHLQ